MEHLQMKNTIPERGSSLIGLKSRIDTAGERLSKLKAVEAIRTEAQRNKVSPQKKKKVNTASVILLEVMIYSDIDIIERRNVGRKTQK